MLFIRITLQIYKILAKERNNEMENFAVLMSMKVLCRNSFCGHNLFC